MNRQDRSRGRFTIGILPGWPAHEDNTPDRYITSVFRGIQTAARVRECNLLLAWGIGRGIDAEVSIPAWPLVSDDTDFVPVGPWNTDGLIVFAPLLNGSRSRYLENLRSEGHPVLFIAAGESGPTVAADNEDGILQAVTHLVQHGHRKISFISGDPKDEGDSKQRLEAFHSAVKKFNLADNPGLIIFGNHNLTDTYNALRKKIAANMEFTAVLASDDSSGIGAMQALKEAGLRIPQDVAVIGFDDQPDALAQIPPLASIHVPLPEIGQRALGLMMDHLEKHARLESISVPTWLVARQSCGCMPGAVLSAADSKALPNSTPIGLSGTDEHKERIIQQLAGLMLTALPLGIIGLNKVQSRRICTSLVESFFESIEGRDLTRFQIKLLEVLHDIESGEGEIHSWQETISVLRRNMNRLPFDWDRPDVQRLAEDLLHQARVAISESVQRRYHQSQYRRNTTDYLLSDLNARLNTVFDEQKAVELLVEHLPKLGINHTRVALFESDGVDVTAWSIGLGTNPDSKEEKFRFPTRQFPPEGYYPADQLLNLAIVPLVLENKPLGYIAFDASNLDPCTAIARQFIATVISARLHEKVVDLSLTDALTGLQNRRYFDLFLKNEVDRSRRFKRGLSIIMIDIDHFKDYNDIFGHPAGDEALKYVSRCLLENRRKADVVARIGGEEFAVILPETNASGALDVARKMCISVANASVLKRQLTISVGVAELEDNESSPEAVIEQADQALYEAKRMGRNRVCIFENRK